jgi:hypothetical protein
VIEAFADDCLPPPRLKSDAPRQLSTASTVETDLRVSPFAHGSRCVTSSASSSGWYAPRRGKRRANSKEPDGRMRGVVPAPTLDLAQSPNAPWMRERCVRGVVGFLRRNPCRRCTRYIIGSDARYREVQLRTTRQLSDSARIVPVPLSHHGRLEPAHCRLRIAERESADIAAALIRQSCSEAKVDPRGLVLHSDARQHDDLNAAVARCHELYQRVRRAYPERRSGSTRNSLPIGLVVLSPKRAPDQGCGMTDATTTSTLTPCRSTAPDGDSSLLLLPGPTRSAVR